MCIYVTSVRVFMNILVPFWGSISVSLFCFDFICLLLPPYSLDICRLVGPLQCHFLQSLFFISFLFSLFFSLFFSHIIKVPLSVTVLGSLYLFGATYAQIAEKRIFGRISHCVSLLLLLVMRSSWHSICLAASRSF